MSYHMDDVGIMELYKSEMGRYKIKEMFVPKFTKLFSAFGYVNKKKAEIFAAKVVERRPLPEQIDRAIDECISTYIKEPSYAEFMTVFGIVNKKKETSNTNKQKDLELYNQQMDNYERRRKEFLSAFEDQQVGEEKLRKMTEIYIKHVFGDNALPFLVGENKVPLRQLERLPLRLLEESRWNFDKYKELLEKEKGK